MITPKSIIAIPPQIPQQECPNFTNPIPHQPQIIPHKKTPTNHQKIPANNEKPAETQTHPRITTARQNSRDSSASRLAHFRAHARPSHRSAVPLPHTPTPRNARNSPNRGRRSLVVWPRPPSRIYSRSCLPLSRCLPPARHHPPRRARTLSST